MIRTVVLLAIATHAHAEPEIRYSLDGAVAMHEGPPGYGAGATVDIGTPVASSLVFAGHFAVSAAWVPYDPAGNPAARLVLPQAHAMFEYRVGRVALAAGMGLDVFHADYDTMGAPTARTILGFGANAQLSVDLARDDRGAFAAIADVTTLPIGGIAIGDEWGGDRGLTLVTLGVAFQPRRP